MYRPRVDKESPHLFTADHLLPSTDNSRMGKMMILGYNLQWLDA